MKAARQRLETWSAFITSPWLIAATAFMAPLITIISPPVFMAFLTILAAALAGPLWLAIYEPESRFSGENLPDRDRVVFWLKWIAAISLLFLIGNINAADTWDALNRTLHVFAAFAVIAIFSSGVRVLPTSSQQQIFQALLWGVIAAGIILTLIGLAHPYRIPFWRETRLVLVPLAPFYNRALVVLVFLGFIAIWRGFAAGYKKRSIAAILLVTAATFLSSSESAKLAVLASVFVGFVTFRWRDRAIWSFGFLSLAWIWLLPWTAETLHNFASSNGWIMANWDSYDPIRTSLGRLEIWTAVSDRIFQHPLMGWGLEAVEHYGLPSLKTIFFSKDYVHHPHNGALQAWIEYGISGVIAWSMAIILICRYLIRQNPADQTLKTSLVFGAIAIIFVAHGLWETWWIGLLGYVYGLAGLVQDKPDASTSFG